MELQRVELGEIATLDVDLDLTVTGFSTGEIDVLLVNEGDPEDENNPPLPEIPRTKPR